jgi:hypothetical protein
MYETIEEMRRLASMTGSIGRLISRFIGRHFTAVLGGYELELRACATRVDSMLEFAVFTAYLQTEARDRNQSGEYQGLSLSVFPWSSSQEVSLIVRINELPETVKKRQALLTQAADAMEGLLHRYRWICERGLLDQQIKSYLGDIYYRRNDESFGIFCDLVKGIYVDLE